MLQALRRHPFSVEAFFEWSLVLTYAVPASRLQCLLSPGLVLDQHGDLGFVAIALVQTRALRPRRFPRWVGRDFFLSGYRIFARFVRPGKQSLRGLQVLRSDTDSASMARWGNRFTHYRYRHAQVEIAREPSRLEVRVHTPEHEAELQVSADLSSRPAALPVGSPFKTAEQARAFAGPLPYTFSYDEASRKMLVVRGLRKAWAPQPIGVTVERMTFLEQPAFKNSGAHLANAFYVSDVPYAWKAGTLEELG